jgi:hypothetical protein
MRVIATAIVLSVTALALSGVGGAPASAQPVAAPFPAGKPTPSN